MLDQKETIKNKASEMNVNGQTLKYYRESELENLGLGKEVSIRRAGCSECTPKPGNSFGRRTR